MSNALEKIKTLKPADIYAKDGGLDEAIKLVKQEADVSGLSVEKNADREKIASIAYKVARSKTALDEMGKELTAEAKAQINKVDSQRRYMREQLDELKESVRLPLTQWENDKKEREERLENLKASAQFIGNPDMTEIEDVRKAANALYQFDWKDMQEDADLVFSQVNEMINNKADERKRYDAERAELAKLRKEKQEREEKERAEKLRLEQEKRIREEEQKKAEAEKKRIEAEKKAAEERAKKAEQEAKLREQQEAERLKKAEEDAKRREKEAAERERQRIADEQAKEKAAAEKREADKKHRDKINAQISDAIQAAGVDADVATRITVLLTSDKIPHVKVTY